MDFKFITNRAKNINETSDKNEVINKYALPLIILGAVSKFIGQIFYSFHNALMSAVIVFVTGFAVMYISAFVINELAPSFGSRKDINAAFKLVVYSSTASYIAAIIANLHISLVFVGLFGLYSIYLIWVGITPIMKTPENKKIGYVVVYVLLLLVISIVFEFILRSVLGDSNLIEPVQ
jgi:ABC-type multidrug transport system permease subunit